MFENQALFILLKIIPSMWFLTSVPRSICKMLGNDIHFQCQLTQIQMVKKQK